MTDGFCSLMEMDHEQLISHLRGSTYEKVHPDDAGKLMKAVSAFLDGRTGFDVIYRSRLGLDSDYHYVHSAGTKVRMPDGGELMAVVYLDLNKCIDETEKLSADYRQLQADHFYTDSLTGLPNMNYLFQFADERVHALRLRGKTPVLFFTDVDSLRFYNSQYGFEKGDQLLTLISRVLREEFPEALVVRGVDDHFIVLAAFEGKESFAERIHAANEKIKRGAFGNTTGIRAGVCVNEDDMLTPVDLDHAKSALKSIGTDLNETYRYHSHVDADRYWSQRYIVENFDRALKNE